MKPGPPKVEIKKLDPDNDPVVRAVMFLIADCMSKGARTVDDKIAIMVPDGVEFSVNKGGPYEEMGEWEITLRKVS